MPRPTRLLTVLLPAILVLALTGCGGSASKGHSGGTSKNLTDSFPLAQASLPSYTASYAITGPVKGSMTWTLTQGATTTGVAIHQVIGSQVEDDRIVLTRKGLRFVSAQETVTAPGHHLTIAAHVKGKRIYETANVDGKAEAVNYPFGSRTLVNVAVLPTLAGIGVQPGQLQVVQDVILKHGVEVPIGFTANSRTKVTTPAGTFQVVPVTLSGSGANQQAFIDTQSHVLVKYLNGQTKFSLVQLSR